MSTLKPGDDVAWIGYGRRVDGVFGEDDGSGTVMILRKEKEESVIPMTWQSQKIGDDWFAFSGTVNGESTFNFPVVKVPV